MSQPATEPGWYRAGPKGLERICGSVRRDRKGRIWPCVR